MGGQLDEIPRGTDGICVDVGEGVRCLGSEFSRGDEERFGGELDDALLGLFLSLLG